MARLGKLYKGMQKQKEVQKRKASMNKVVPVRDEFRDFREFYRKKIEMERLAKEKEEEQKESVIGQTLSDLSMKRLIIIVMLLYFAIPFFASEYYNEYELGYDFELGQIAEVAFQTKNNTTAINDTTAIPSLIDDYVAKYQNDKRPLVAIL